MNTAQNRANVNKQEYSNIDSSPISSPSVNAPTVALTDSTTTDLQEIDSAMMTIQDEDLPHLLVAMDYSQLYERQGMIQQELTNKNL